MLQSINQTINQITEQLLNAPIIIPIINMASMAAMALGISDEDKHIVGITSTEIQLSKKQDYTVKGTYKNHETGEQFEWLALFDGHGHDVIIDAIRKIDLNQFVAHENPPKALQDYITEKKILQSWVSSGSTMCLAKIYKDKIVCFSVGDSFLFVYEDGKKVYKNALHKWENLAEQQRLNTWDLQVRTEPSKGFTVLTPTTLTGKDCTYIKYGNERLLAASQAIGHNNMTGISPDIFEIEIKTGSFYRVLMASDGVFDVLMENEDENLGFSTKTSEEIAKFAEARWRQSWHLANPVNNSPILGSEFRFTAPSHFDDISVGVVDIVPF